MIGPRKVYVGEFNPDALRVFKDFSKKVGAEHIASPVGIHVLLDILDEVRPRHILEVGGGIGTLSQTILKYSDADVDIFEDDSFCLGELKESLKGFENRYTIITDYENFTLPRGDYDLVIIDGGGHHFIYTLINKINHIGRIMIEGGRGEQRKQTRKALRNRYVFKPVQYVHSEGKYKGAHQIICYPNDSSLFRFFSYWFWEIVIFEEIRSSLRHRLGKFFFSHS